MHKPSILWPPPGEAESKEIRQGIRRSLRTVTGLRDQDRFKSFLRSIGRTPRQKHEPTTANQVADVGTPIGSGAYTSGPSAIDEQTQGVVLEMEGKEPLVVESQIQFYAPNNLLSHPLICHCRAYLGGLPPLLFTAGDQEVLRDEIIYTCVFSPHCSIPLLMCIPELTEQQTHLSSRSWLNPNDSIPRSRNSQRDTPLRLGFTSKFMMGVHTSCPSCLRSPLLRNTASERSPAFVVS